MPSYTFRIVSYDYSKRKLTRFAQTCGLRWNEEEGSLRFFGDVTPANAMIFAGRMDELDVEYLCDYPEYDEICNVDLVNVVFSKLDSPSRYGQETRAVVYQLMQGAETVADLANCSFATVMDSQRQMLSVLRNWRYLACILRFMIDHKVDFCDFSPHGTLTSIDELRLSVHVRWRLREVGLTYVEFFSHITLAELLDVNAIGDKTLGELRRELPLYGIEL